MCSLLIIIVLFAYIVLVAYISFLYGLCLTLILYVNSGAGLALKVHTATDRTQTKINVSKCRAEGDASAY